MIIPKHKTYQNYLLAILVISGALKVALDYYDYPFDITFQILSLIFIDIIYCCLIDSKRPRINKNDLVFILLILLFYCSAIFSLLYTSSVSFAYKKVLLMTIPLISLLYVKLIKKLDLIVLYKLLHYVILPAAVWFILFKYLLWNNSNLLSFLIDKPKFSPLRQEYLNFGVLIGLYSLLSIEFSKKPLVSILISVLLILGIASRGALIFLVLTYLIIYYSRITNFIFNLKVKKHIIKSLILVLIPVFILGLFFIEAINKALYYGLARMSSLINIESDTSALGRLDQYLYVIKEGITLKGLFFGHGIGSFGMDYVGIDESAYPHNIFLEAWYEMGFISMCILLLFFLLPFMLNKPILYKSLAFFALLNAMKSLSFAYDRNLFILFGILIFHGYKNELKSAKQIES